MPKKRNAAQRIGAIGEDRFRLSCQENFIIPNKVEHDFGFDFLCQPDLAASFGRTGPVSGVFVGFSVRATNRDDGRIRLNRADAECLLAAQFPTGLALVQLNGPKSAAVYFRMMDAAFIVELSHFLASAKKAKHFTPTDMRPLAEIRDAIGEVGAPGYLEQVRADAARRIAEPITGPVQIQIHRDADSQATLITSLDLYAWFEQGTPAEQEALYLATFGEPARRDQRMRELALNGKVMGGLAHLPEPYVLAGFVMDHPTTVCVQTTPVSAELPVLRTANEHHFGYVYPAGFALTVSARVEKDGQYVHLMQALADPDSDALLADHPVLLEFLTTCHPESVFCFDNGDGLTLDVTYFDSLGDLARCAATTAMPMAWTAGTRCLSWSKTWPARNPETPLCSSARQPTRRPSRFPGDSSWRRRRWRRRTATPCLGPFTSQLSATWPTPASSPGSPATDPCCSMMVICADSRCPPSAWTPSRCFPGCRAGPCSHESCSGRGR